MTDDLTTRLLAAIEDEQESAEHAPWCASVYREWENSKPTTCNCDRLEVAERMATAHRKIVATAKADLVDLAAGYDLTTEPAP